MFREIAHALAAGLIGAVVAAPAAAQAPPGPARDQITVALTDPSRIGVLDVSVFSGSVTVRGTARKDVHIQSTPHDDAGPARGRNDPPPPGLRRLTQRGGFEVEEEENVVTIRADSPMRGRDFVIEVPARTNLMLKNVQGAIQVDAVDGDIEVQAVQGDVTLTGVSGTVVAHTVDGTIKADIRRVAAGKAMSFVSVDGAIDVTLPASLKANLKMGSVEGDIYTDFDLQRAPGQTGGGARRGRRIQVDTTIEGTVNGGGPDYQLRTVDGNIYVRMAR